MSFRDGTMAQRWQQMGDRAEGAFTHVYQNVEPAQLCVKYGLDRAPFPVHQLSEFVRYTPDFLTARGLVEVQGFGRDQIFKLKVDKWQALLDWNEIQSTYLWVWDSAHSEYAWVRLTDLDVALHEAVLNHELDDTHGVWPDDALIYLDAFPEGKAFWAVHKGALPTVDGWHEAEVPDVAA